MDHRISIITPVYNAGNFIAQTLDALIAQTHKNIEVLCVNDGSKDNSLQILEDYAAKDSRIRVFDQENSGPARSRNVGLENATGEYLMFCDADDFYEPTMCEDMLNAIVREDVDFAMCDCNVIEESDNHGRSEINKNYHYSQFFNKIPLTQILKSKINVLLWNKIFKMDMIRKYGINFPDGYESDDNAFVYRYLAISFSFFGLKKKLYNYRVQENSIMGNLHLKKQTKRLFDYIYIFTSTLGFFKKYDLFDGNKWILKNLNNNITHVSNFFNEEDRIKYLELMKEEVLSNFDVSEFEPFYNLTKLYSNTKETLKTKGTVTVKGNFIFKKKTFDNKKKYYFCGIPVFKKSTFGNKKKHYILGIKVYQKDIRSLEDILNIVIRNNKKILKDTQNILKDNQNKSKQLKKFVQDSLYSTTQKNLLMQLGIYYKDLPRSERYILCADCLYDKDAEAIDAYTFFKYLQSKGIKSKYIVLKDNVKAKEIEGNSDVVVVSSIYDFVYTHINLIAKSSIFLSSFGLLNLDKYLKSLPFIKRVYINHGVVWLKKWACSLCNSEKYDYILTPSKKTEELYLTNGYWDDKLMIKSGLPRWDNLVKEHDEQKNIFLFFTWRKTFEGKPHLAQKYLDYILNLLKNPYIEEIATRQNVKINLSLHHSLFYNKVTAPEIPDYINLVDSSKISKQISKTDLLITDYSSICFDFMYLNTPVAFYLFDADDLSLNNLDQCTLLEMMQEEKYLYNYCYTEEALVEKIEHYINNDFTLEPENLEKNNQIFWDKRTNNCEQLYQSILKLDKNDK